MVVELYRDCPSHHRGDRERIGLEPRLWFDADRQGAAGLGPPAVGDRDGDRCVRCDGRVRIGVLIRQNTGRIDGDRVYNASGSPIGRIDGDRLYNASGKQIGKIDGDRLYDGSGRPIGRADGMRRMQMIVFFYFFM